MAYYKVNIKYESHKWDQIFRRMNLFQYYCL